MAAAVAVAAVAVVAAVRSLIYGKSHHSKVPLKPLKYQEFAPNPFIRVVYIPLEGVYIGSM